MTKESPCARRGCTAPGVYDVDMPWGGSVYVCGDHFEEAMEVVAGGA